MDSVNSNLTLDQFREVYPVSRSLHTGKYGWRRVNGCLNLNACAFDSEAEAEQDRDENYINRDDLSR